jgi:thiamine-phosphate pyrophosphorylase
VGLDYVREAAQMLAETGIGHVAIGGMNLQNIDQVLKAGAKAIAVCSAITEAKDPIAACRTLKERMAALDKELA